MRSIFAIIILLFEILGLIITLVERRERIKHGFGRASWLIKNKPWRNFSNGKIKKIWNKK